MIIRRLIESDLKTYFDCRLRALKETPTAFLISYEEELARGGNHYLKSLGHTGGERAIFGAINNDVVVGTVGIYKENYPKTAHKAFIWGVHVDSNQRRKGIAKELLQEAIRFAREQMEVKAIRLSLESKNIPAKQLYEANGFVCWGTEPMAMKHENQYLNEDHMVLAFT